MSEEPLKVIAGAPDSPLMIGETEIPCYVLEDETRVLVQRGIATGMGMSAMRGQRIGDFVASKSINPFISNELNSVIKNPIKFQPPTGGRIAYGYSATILVDICNAVLSARDAGALHSQQQHIAERCDLLVRALAKVGIIALVDEATGYQRIRAERALATILEKWITNDVQKWTRTFPIEFYLEIARLRGWPTSYSIKRPSIVGHYTDDFVYARLAPGVLEELKRKTPRLPSGRLKNRYFQWFTPEYGHPRLKEHLAAVVALMRAAPRWDSFKRSLNRAFPVQNTNLELPLDYDD